MSPRRAPRVQRQKRNIWTAIEVTSTVIFVAGFILAIPAVIGYMGWLPAAWGITADMFMKGVIVCLLLGFGLLVADATELIR